jgi:hypothetical protein
LKGFDIVADNHFASEAIMPDTFKGCTEVFVLGKGEGLPEGKKMGEVTPLIFEFFSKLNYITFSSRPNFNGKERPCMLFFSNYQLNLAEGKIQKLDS